MPAVLGVRKYMDICLASIVLDWVPHIDLACIYCNWYDVPGGPFGPLGAAAAGAAAAAAAAAAVKDMMSKADDMMSEAAYQDWLEREHNYYPAAEGSQHGFSTASEALDPSWRAEEPDLLGPPLPPRPPGQPPEI